MELIFVRHTSVDVPRGTCYGQTDVPLNDSFPEEAASVKNRLNGMHFDAVYCSPLSRCRRLAEYCVDQPIIYDPRLLEINFGEWEMQLFEQIKDPRIHEWYADYVNVRATGGESFMDQHLRLRDFITYLQTKGYERVAIFTHGGILMQAMLMFGLATPENIIERQPAYGEVLKVNTRETPNP